MIFYVSFFSLLLKQIQYTRYLGMSDTNIYTKLRQHLTEVRHERDAWYRRGDSPRSQDASITYRRGPGCNNIVYILIFIQIPRPKVFILGGAANITVPSAISLSKYFVMENVPPFTFSE